LVLVEKRRGFEGGRVPYGESLEFVSCRRVRGFHVEDWKIGRILGGQGKRSGERVAPFLKDVAGGWGGSV